MSEATVAEIQRIVHEAMREVRSQLNQTHNEIANVGRSLGGLEDVRRQSNAISSLQSQGGTLDQKLQSFHPKIDHLASMLEHIPQSMADAYLKMDHLRGMLTDASV